MLTTYYYSMKKQAKWLFEVEGFPSRNIRVLELIEKHDRHGYPV